MTFRVAAVSFLNTLPLVDWLEGRDGDEITLTRDLPSRLTNSLRDGSADVALLPVAEILRGVSGGILPVAGIACRGAVDSVKLFTMDDLPDLNHISADRGSRSSVALLKVLLTEKTGAVPDVSETEPRVGLLPAQGEGILIIGDRCFEYEKFLRESGNNEVRIWDLGQLWWELTELPFVFAVWAVAPDYADRAGPAAVIQLKDLLAESLRHGLENRSALAAREAGAGRLGHLGYATAQAIDYYFRQSLIFTIGDDELAGIRRFHQLAVKHGIIPEGPPPPVL